MKNNNLVIKNNKNHSSKPTNSKNSSRKYYNTIKLKDNCNNNKSITNLTLKNYKNNNKMLIKKVINKMVITIIQKKIIRMTKMKQNQ